MWPWWGQTHWHMSHLIFCPIIGMEGGWVQMEAKTCFFDFTSLFVTRRTGVAPRFLSGFPNLRLPLLPNNFRFLHLFRHLKWWQFLSDKWDLQTLAEAPDNRAKVDRNGRERPDRPDEWEEAASAYPSSPSFHSRAALLFWELPKANLMVTGTDLTVPSAQMSLWHFTKLWLTNGSYWKTESFFLALRSLNIAWALTLVNWHVSFIQLF